MRCAAISRQNSHDRDPRPRYGHERAGRAAARAVSFSWRSAPSRRPRFARGGARHTACRRRSRRSAPTEARSSSTMPRPASCTRTAPRAWDRVRSGSWTTRASPEPCSRVGREIITDAYTRPTVPPTADEQTGYDACPDLRPHHERKGATIGVAEVLNKRNGAFGPRPHAARGHDVASVRGHARGTPAPGARIARTGAGGRVPQRRRRPLVRARVDDAAGARRLGGYEDARLRARRSS